MANFVSSLTGEELNQALMLTNLRESERWAVGTAGGIPVPVADETHDNNSKAWAERAEDAANRAEAAVPAGTAGAVFFDRAQTLTTAQQEQARQNIKAGGSNRNLLDNPWFASGFVVNQRGFSSKTVIANNEYILDRWNISLGTDSALFELTENGLRIVPNGNYANIRQPFETARANSFIGVPMTASVMLADGTIRSGTLIWSGTQAEYFFGNPSTFSAYLGASGAFIVRCVSDTTIKAVKLEFGSVSTLANDAPPNYAEELAKCQRYFIAITASNNWHPMGFGLATNGTTAYITLPIPVAMRTGTITVTVPNITNLNLTGGGSINIALTSIAYRAISENAVSLTITTSGLTQGEAYVLYSKAASTTIQISADL